MKIYIQNNAGVVYYLTFAVIIIKLMPAPLENK